MSRWIRCPKCGSENNRVKETRKVAGRENGGAQKRECECGHFFTCEMNVVDRKPSSKDIMWRGRRVKVFYFKESSINV